MAEELVQTQAGTNLAVELGIRIIVENVRAKLAMTGQPDVETLLLPQWAESLRTAEALMPRALGVRAKAHHKWKAADLAEMTDLANALAQSGLTLPEAFIAQIRHADIPDSLRRNKRAMQISLNALDTNAPTIFHRFLGEIDIETMSL